MKTSKNKIIEGKGQIKIKLKYTSHDFKFIIMILFARNLVIKNIFLFASIMFFLIRISLCIETTK